MKTELMLEEIDRALRTEAFQNAVDEALKKGTLKAEVDPGGGVSIEAYPEMPDYAELREKFLAIIEAQKEAKDGGPEEEEQKPEEKAYHCRICGRRYHDKGEVKECARSHGWQNQRGAEMMEEKRPCSGCGEVDELEVQAKKSPKLLCYFVRCPKCGLESAKHREPEEAIRDWNRMGEYNEQEG